MLSQIEWQNVKQNIIHVEKKKKFVWRKRNFQHDEKQISHEQQVELVKHIDSNGISIEQRKRAEERERYTKTRPPQASVNSQRTQLEEREKENNFQSIWLEMRKKISTNYNDTVVKLNVNRYIFQMVRESTSDISICCFPTRRRVWRRGKNHEKITNEPKLIRRCHHHESSMTRPTMPIYQVFYDLNTLSRALRLSK